MIVVLLLLLAVGGVLFLVCVLRAKAKGGKGGKGSSGDCHEDEQSLITANFELLEEEEGGPLILIMEK